MSHSLWVERRTEGGTRLECGARQVYQYQGRQSAAGCAAQEEEDENAEAEAENQEGKLAWAGGRREEATYEAGDAEDTAIAAAAQRAAQQQDDVPDVSPDVSTQPILVLSTDCLLC